MVSILTLIGAFAPYLLVKMRVGADRLWRSSFFNAFLIGVKSGAVCFFAIYGYLKHSAKLDGKDGPA